MQSKRSAKYKKSDFSAKMDISDILEAPQLPADASTTNYSYVLANNAPQPNSLKLVFHKASQQSSSATTTSISAVKKSKKTHRLDNDVEDTSQPSEESTQNKRNKPNTKLTISPHKITSYFLIEFLSKIDLFRNKHAQSLVRNKAPNETAITALKDILRVEASDTYQAYIEYSNHHFIFLDLEKSNLDQYTLSIMSDDDFEIKDGSYELRNNASPFLVIKIDTEKDKAINVIQKQSKFSWNKNKIKALVDQLNLLFNYQVTYDNITEKPVASDNVFEKDEFTQKLIQYVDYDISKRVHIVINSSRFISDTHVFKIKWPTKAGQNPVELTCHFYSTPFIYGSHRDDIASWVHSEDEMLKDYCSDNKIQSVISENNKKRTKNSEMLRYYWLKVFCGNYEILKLWVTLDSSVGELRDLKAPLSTGELSGIDCIKIFDYLDSQFLKIRHTYLCDDAGSPYTYEHGKKTIHDKIPFRVTFPILYQGLSFYSKYLPGFSPLECTNRFNKHFKYTITSDPSIYYAAVNALRTLPISNLYEEFKDSYDVLLDACEYIGFLNATERKDLERFELKKNIILMELVNKFFPEVSEEKSESPLEVSAAATSASSSTASVLTAISPEQIIHDNIKKRLDKITFGTLLESIQTHSRNSGSLSDEMKKFNCLLKLPWGTLNYVDENPFTKNGYYYLLHELLANGRFWERLRIEKPQSNMSQSSAAAQPPNQADETMGVDLGVTQQHLGM